MILSRPPLLAIVCGLGLASSANAEDLRSSTSRIDAVTVFTSGAEVTRLVAVRVPAGSHTLVIDDLPGLVLTSGPVVELAAGKVDIGATEVRVGPLIQPRALVSPGSTPEVTALEQEKQSLEAEQHKIAAQLASAQIRKTLVGAIPSLLQASGIAAPTIDLAKTIETAATQSEQAERTIAEAGARKTKLVERLAHVNVEIANLLASAAPAVPSADLATQAAVARIELAAETEQQATLKVRYVVRNASWTPHYTARLTSGGAGAQAATKIALTRTAHVTQQTGESWDGIALTVATADAGRRSALPALPMLAAEFDTGVKSGPAKSPEVRVGDAAQALAGGEWSNARAGRIHVAYEVAGRSVVPSQAQAKRVRLGEHELAAWPVVVATPRIDPSAFLYARFDNETGVALAPGRIRLYRDGAFVGEADFPQLSAGDKHEMGFGATSWVRVTRVVPRDIVGRTGYVRTSNADERAVQIHVQNLTKLPLDLVVRDQVPVATHEDIKVEQKLTPEPTTKDLDGVRGVHAWEIRLKGEEKREIAIDYKITWPQGRQIVLDRKQDLDILRAGATVRFLGGPRPHEQ